jgi:hypothetical protein
MMKTTRGRSTRARRTGVFRSGFEANLFEQLRAAGYQLDAIYERHAVPYTIPASNHVYIPDFVLMNGIVIEAKGRLLLADRKKMLFVRDQHPDLDIRFVITSAKTKPEGLRITMAEWCVKFDFQFAIKRIPQEWLNEPGSRRRGVIDAFIRG